VLRGDRIHREGNPGADHPEQQHAAEQAAEVPFDAQRQHDHRESQAGQEYPAEGGREGADLRHQQADEEEAGAPDGGEAEQAKVIGGAHGWIPREWVAKCCHLRGGWQSDFRRFALFPRQ